MENVIRIKGARQHNLKNINLELPKNKLIVFTGLSGSGKSSLAFDTIYAEGQRRYVESLSSYARQFLGVMDKPDVDSIEGLSPAISIDQKSGSHNPRSTVGTVTEIYDYLRLLFARIGHPHCPNCGREVTRQSQQQIIEQIIKLAAERLKNKTIKYYRFAILAPVVRDRKGEFTGLFDNLRAKGFRNIRVDGRFMGIDEDLLLMKTNKHTIEVLVDKISIDDKTIKFLLSGQGRKDAILPSLGKAKNAQKDAILPYVALKSRVADAVEQSLNLSDGLVVIGSIEDAGFAIPDKPKHVTDHIFSEKFSCPVCNISIPEIEPRSFSFNSPHGACTVCSGLGSILTVDPDLVIRKELSITEGGILPFARMFFHDTWFSRVITTVAQIYDINPRLPLAKLTKKQMDVLLSGTGDKTYLVKGQNRFGDLTTIEEPYRGIIPELKRRYNESASDFMRAEIEKYMREETCTACRGKRLKKEALTVTVDGFSIADVTDLSVRDSLEWVNHLPKTLSGKMEEAIAAPIVKEIGSRLAFLDAVGLNYLTLGRSATTLSGGEAQRIRLASQIGSGLSGVLYVLDEPSIGLHQKDNVMLINTLKRLRDLNNTVIVVEHDRETMESADWIVDFGPGAGEHGGAVVAQGTPDTIKANNHSLTGKYLTGEKNIVREKPSFTKTVFESDAALTVVGASQHNLKRIDASFPLGKLIAVTGVSGSGKSTLIVETLYRALHTHFNPFAKEKPGAHDRVDGLESVDKVILIDQSPIGRTPRSNPATYTGAFSPIREIFANTQEARLAGYLPGRFSFNVSAKGGSASGGKGGRCEACEGEGQKKIEMQFLSDIYVTCDECGGKRYNAETLEVQFNGKNISQVLDMTITEAREFFIHHPSLSEKLKTIEDVGLGYIHLGQPAPTLSGGEAQRVKLASELSKRATGRTLYILDEPTTGLHFADLEKLLSVLHRLTQIGNTVVVIEHNLDVIKNSDWIIDLGPDGGDAGGKIVATGTPQNVSRIKTSYTGQYLRKVLQ